MSRLAQAGRPNAETAWISTVLFLLCLTLYAQDSQAAGTGVSVHFKEGKFSEFVRLVYGEISFKSYILDPVLIKDEQLITVKLHDVTNARLEAETTRLAKVLGYSVTESNGIVRVGKPSSEPEPKEMLVYRPLHRSVSYLMDLANGLFPKDSFSGYRASPVLQQSPAPGIGQGVQNTQGSMVAQSVVQNTAQNRQTQTPVQGVSETQINKADQDIIIFNGTDKDKKKLLDLLAQIDTPSFELLVKAVVYEVRKVESEGSALNLAASILGGKFGISIDGGALPGNAIKFKVGQVDAIFSALSSDKRFKLVSAPVIRMRSGTNAKFTAGSDVPVLGNITVQNGASQQSVEYKSSGVILDLQATARDDATDLKIGQQISSFVPTTTGVNQSPTLLKRELMTNVTTHSDEVVVLGGLDETQDTGDDTGLSFLPNFMRSTGSNKQSTEIMVLLNVQRI